MKARMAVPRVALTQKDVSQEASQEVTEECMVGQGVGKVGASSKIEGDSQMDEESGSSQAGQSPVLDKGAGMTGKFASRAGDEKMQSERAIHLFPSSGK